MRKLKFKKYNDVDEFKVGVLDILLEDEVVNNLPISVLIDSKRDNAADWLLSTVVDEQGTIVLIAVCTKPFNLLLYEPGGLHNDPALEFLASELKRIKFAPPGVLAKSELAQRFTNVYCGGSGSSLHMSMVLMRLDELADYSKAPGFSRILIEDDLLYTPKWERAFCIDCNIHVYTLSENEERIRTRLGKDAHFIWEDGEPVAQAVIGRNTPNSAVISWVYTPPPFRGRGYATSVVAEVSKSAFDKGKRFCCLFADAANPVSCGVYSKLGYYKVCLFDEIRFDTVDSVT